MTDTTQPSSSLLHLAPIPGRLYRSKHPGSLIALPSDEQGNIVDSGGYTITEIRFGDTFMFVSRRLSMENPLNSWHLSPASADLTVDYVLLMGERLYVLRRRYRDTYDRDRDTEFGRFFEEVEHT